MLMQCVQVREWREKKMEAMQLEMELEAQQRHRMEERMKAEAEEEKKKRLKEKEKVNYMLTVVSESLLRERFLGEIRRSGKLT